MARGSGITAESILYGDLKSSGASEGELYADLAQQLIEHDSEGAPSGGAEHDLVWTIASVRHWLESQDMPDASAHGTIWDEQLHLAADAYPNNKMHKRDYVPFRGNGTYEDDFSSEHRVKHFEKGVNQLRNDLPEPSNNATTDILFCLRHWAKRYGIDWNYALKQAEKSYYADKESEWFSDSDSN